MQALLQRRRRNRDQARVERHAVVDGQHVLVGQPAHHRQLRSIDAGGHVAEVFPGVAAIARAEQVLAAGVDRGRIERRQHHRRVPVGVVPFVAQHLLRHVLAPRVPVAPIADRALRIAGPDVLAAPRARVVALQAEELAGREHVTRIRGIRHREESIAAAQPRPVLVEDAVRGPARARSLPAAVVLQAAIDVVGPLVVDRDAVVLRHRQVLHVEELQAAIERDADAAVVQLDHVARVLRVDPHEAIVAVRGRVRRRERFAAVVRERILS